MKKLSEDQYNFGVEELRELSVDLNIGTIRLARILLKIQKLKKFWDWVNAEEFLYQYLGD